MMVHGGIPLGDAWAYLRDHLQGTTPYAADQIAACRTFTPPSKAHKKRLSKSRPDISMRRTTTKVTSRPELPIMEAMRLGHEVRKLVQPGKYLKARPLDVPEEETLVPRPYCPFMRNIQLELEAARIASYGSNELKRAWTVYQQRT